MTVYSLLDPEAFAQIERVATEIAVQLREFGDHASGDPNGPWTTS